MVIQFVKDVHRSVHTKPLSTVLTSKPGKVKKSAINSTAENVDFFDITGTLRKKIVEWQNSRTDIRLRSLKEKTDYKIEVKSSEKEDGGYVAAIFCEICGEKKLLGVDSRGCIKLSNWYRHIGKCIDRKTSTPTPKIDCYLSSCSTKSSTAKSSTASIVIPEDTSALTPTLENETIVVTDKESTSIPLTRGTPDKVSTLIESEPEKAPAGSSATANELLAAVSNSVLDSSTSILSASTSGEAQVFWQAPPIVEI